MDVRIVVTGRKQMEDVIQQIKQSTQQEEISDARRGHWRIEYTSPGTVTPEGRSPQSEPIYIDTRDISVDGLGFLSKHDLPVGQKVVVGIETDFGDLEVPATVVHNTPSVGTRKIGVKFDLADT